MLARLAECPQNRLVVGVSSVARRCSLAVVTPVDRHSHEAARREHPQQEFHPLLAVSRAMQHDHGREFRRSPPFVFERIMIPGTRCPASLA